MKPALLVIDVQRYFFSRPASQAQLQELIPNINELIDLFHQTQRPVLHLLTVHRADGSTGDLWMKENHRLSLIEGTSEAEEYPEIHKTERDCWITKTRHSAFIRTDLESVLRQMGVDTLIITGYSTNGCVGLTAIDGYERDFHVILAGDAIRGFDQRRSDQMLSVLHDEFGIDPVPNAVIM